MQLCLSEHETSVELLPLMEQSALLALVAEGPEAWNEWADDHPDAKVDFSDVAFDQDVSFAGFHFPEKASFYRATFEGDADFSEAIFTGYALFSEATFSDRAIFSEAIFSDRATFSEATFSDRAIFPKATFEGDADFRETKFSGRRADFREATFSGRADFHEAKFWGRANFNETTFSDHAVFSEATFTGDAYFSGATFMGDAYFSEATFAGDAVFCKATFIGEADLNEATFPGNASFSSVTIDGRVEFLDTEFHGIPDFHAVKNVERIALDTVEFTLPKPTGRPARLLYWATGIRGSDRATIIRVRQIRGIANANHAIDAERDLTILERNAQVGSAWTGLKKLRPFKEWWRALSTVFFSTPLLLAYRWSSNYGRSVKWPLLWLLASWFLWYVVYLKLYMSTGRSLSGLNLSALNDIARSGMLPLGTVLRPSYTAAIETLFDKDAGIPSGFQNALLLQNVTSLIFLFLIGLALRNFFRLK